jgi:hypothetical protein
LCHFELLFWRAEHVAARKSKERFEAFRIRETWNSGAERKKEKAPKMPWSLDNILIKKYLTKNEAERT